MDLVLVIDCSSKQAVSFSYGFSPEAWVLKLLVVKAVLVLVTILVR
jgi:hypothetical protein